LAVGYLVALSLNIGAIKNSPVFGEHFSELMGISELFIFGIRIPAHFCAFWS
jgi:hypothetical protein